MSSKEHLEQVKLFRWAKEQSGKYPQLNLMFAIPNGGLRNVITAVNLKQEGVKSGVPDLFLPCPTNTAHGLFVEMKSQKGRLSPNQKEWLKSLSANGYQCSVCYSFTDAKEVIINYLGVKE